MADYVTRSGIHVVDRRDRALPPRANMPNSNPDPVNPPPTTVNPPGDYNPISVGPTSSEGFGNTHVMYPDDETAALYGMTPVDTQAWSGWPVGWAAPGWNAGSLGRWQALVDVVFACVDLNSGVLATMPAYLTRGSEIQESPPWLTNPEPMVYNSWNEFARQMWWHYQIVGEVIVYATARYAPTSAFGGRPMRFMCLNPAFVTIEIQDGVRRYFLGGEDITADVLHLRYLDPTNDNPHGLGPLEAAGARVLAVEALTRYATDIARQGGVPLSVLKYPRRLSTKQRGMLVTEWINARRSAAGAPAILADGVDFETVSAPPNTGLAELARFSESRVAVLLKVPPFLVGLPSGGDSMTYSNVTSLFDYHWRAGLRPMAGLVMADLSNWLLPAGTSIELNRDDYTRPGMLELAQSYEILTRIGALSVEQVRQMERFTSPSSSTALTSTAEQQPPQQAPVPPATTQESAA